MLENLLKLKYEFNSNVILRETETLVMAYNAQTGDMLEFNDIGGDLIKLLKENNALINVFESLTEIYDATIDEMYEDVSLFVDRMLQLGIIKEKED